MQPNFHSSRILLPVRPWFIATSLFIALLLNFLPTSHWPWMPDWVALVLVFWSVREPRRVGMGAGFLLGLVMDVADASLLGQHALAYVLVTYAAAAISRREPDLRSAVSSWLAAGEDAVSWVEWEQRKQERLLAA